MIHTKKINLSNISEREEYSSKLQEFEKQFTYPLGNDKFYIQHGDTNKVHNKFTQITKSLNLNFMNKIKKTNENKIIISNTALANSNLKSSDYFSFFEKLGKPNIMVLEKDNKIIGVCSAVLREINQKKYWYLCDFKIEKEYRGQKLYRQLMWKYFLPCYIQSQNAFAINMANPDNNKLFSHMGKIFKAFNVNIEPNYLYSFKGKNIVELDSSFWDNHLIVSNNGEKDIVIQGQSQKLFHIVEKDHFQNNLNKFTRVLPNQINDNDSVMFLSREKLNLHFAEESVISSFLKGKNFLKISSAEI